MKKMIALIGTSALLLFLGAATPAYAQEQHDDQGKPESAPPKTPDDKAKPEKEKPAKEKPAKPPKDQPKEQPKTEKQSQQADQQTEHQEKDQQKAQKDQAKAQEKNQKEQQKSVKKNDEQQRQYAQQQNGREGGEQGGGHGRIPDDRFKAHFGREHHFHVGHPQVVGGRPQFSYGGYSFVIVQAWPGDWGYDDDVYVVDDDGVYYLCDVAHPGVQLELNVVL